MESCDKAAKIAVNGKKYYYQTFYNEAGGCDAVRLYDEAGAFVREFLSIGDMTAYLTGNDDVKAVDASKSALADTQAEIQGEFMRRFEKLQGGKGYQEFADVLGLNRSTVYNYAHGVRFPTAAALANIADRCGVSVDWLLGREGE